MRLGYVHMHAVGRDAGNQLYRTSICRVGLYGLYGQQLLSQGNLTKLIYVMAADFVLTDYCNGILGPCISWGIYNSWSNCLDNHFCTSVTIMIYCSHLEVCCMPGFDRKDIWLNAVLFIFWIYQIKNNRIPVMWITGCINETPFCISWLITDVLPYCFSRKINDRSNSPPYGLNWKLTYAAGDYMDIICGFSASSSLHTHSYVLLIVLMNFSNYIMEVSLVSHVIIVHS